MFKGPSQDLFSMVALPLVSWSNINLRLRLAWVIGFNKEGLNFFFNFFSFSSYQLQSYSTSHQYMNLSATGTNLRLVGLTVHGCLGPKPSGSMHIRIELLINIVHKHHSSHMTLHKESILK
jgi:hypothetical protein